MVEKLNRLGWEPLLKDNYTIFSLLLLCVLVAVMIVNRLYVESGSDHERFVYIFCGAIFAAAALLNVSLLRDTTKSAMDRTHALARFGMFCIGSAMALYIAFQGV